MADIYKFPSGGYDVTVFKKQDILDCIDKNIVDKEVMLSIIEHCEKDAAHFISKGKWTGIPFIGNIKPSRLKLLEQSEEQKTLMEEAKEELTSEQYLLFRTQLAKDNSRRIKQERYYRYVTSIAVNKNKLVYRKLMKRKGDAYARIFLYTCYNATIFDPDYELY